MKKILSIIIILCFIPSSLCGAYISPDALAVRAAAEKVQKEKELSERAFCAIRSFDHSPATNIYSLPAINAGKAISLVGASELFSEAADLSDQAGHIVADEIDPLREEVAAISKDRMATPDEIDDWVKRVQDSKKSLIAIADKFDLIYEKYKESPGEFLADPDTEEGAEQNLEGISGNLKKLIAIFENRIRFIKGEVLKENLDVMQLVRNATSPFAGRYDDDMYPGVEIINEPVEPVCISGDEITLLNSVADIVGNAMTAAGDHVGSDNIKVDISVTKKDGYVIISISDNGPGVLSEYLKIGPNGRKIVFDMHNSTRGLSGIGLGTTEAWNAMKMHNGTIIAEPNLDGGATFIIRLPISTGETPCPEPVAGVVKGCS